MDAREHIGQTCIEHLVRISAGATVSLFGDGKLLSKSPEFYFDSDAIAMEADLTNVAELVIVVSNDHHERCEAPYRKGLDPCPVLVRACTFFNHVCLAGAVTRFGGGGTRRLWYASPW